MNWIAITPAHLLTGKAAVVVKQLQTLLLGTDQPDPSPEVIADVTRQIRIEIAACDGNQLDQRINTIPAELESLAIRMVLRQLQSRLNAVGALPLSEDERDERREDIRRLERIARCELPISKPDYPVAPAVQSTTPGPRISPKTHHFRDQDGL